MSFIFGGFSMILFAIVPFLFCLVFVIVILHMASKAKQWNKNNHSPVLTVEAKVVTKRADVSHYQNQNMTTDMNTTAFSSSSTRYFATFEVESGDRLELSVPDTEYGMLVEGDTGRLTFQGTRFLGFERSGIQGA